jgi:hemolysin activation/secretion protein
VCSACEHGKNKYRCATCKAARGGQPALSRKRKRDPEIKPEPEVKLEHPEIKPEPEIKQEPEPFTIRGYFGIGD